MHLVYICAWVNRGTVMPAVSVAALLSMGSKFAYLGGWPYASGLTVMLRGLDSRVNVIYKAVTRFGKVDK